MTVDLNRLTMKFDRSAIKQREGGGGKKLDYIETHTCIHRLNDATDNQWDFEIVDLRKEDNLYICLGKLTIPELGTRMGIGVQAVINSKQEDLVKGAASDALKKAATLFGVALELYGPDYEAETPKPITVSAIEQYSAKQLLAKALEHRGSKTAWDNLFTKLGGDAEEWVALLGQITDPGLLAKLRDKALSLCDPESDTAMLITGAADVQLAKITTAS